MPYALSLSSFLSFCYNAESLFFKSSVSLQECWAGKLHLVKSFEVTTLFKQSPGGIE